MSGLIRAYIKVRGHGARGPRYQVRMNQPDGMVIVESTTEPLFAAARVLLNKGITGNLQIWDDSRSFYRMQGDIEYLAALTVSEGQHGIALRKYADRAVKSDIDNEATPEAHTEIECPRSVLPTSQSREAS